MNYEETREYLEQLNNRGIKPGLGSITDLCDALGNPESALRFIHVAGTNGKGSTSAFIAGILRASGYRVGVYSSPAVFEEREIISVNGRNISKENYVNLIGTIAETGLKFTRFELETALAFLYFKEKECDFVVLECGMGGELDATNVVKNTEAAVFTSIGMDHMQYLGDTLEKIAATKGGIIKPGSSVVVSGDNDTVVKETLCKLADGQGSNVTIADPAMITKSRFSLSGTAFDYKELKGLKITLLGTNQPQNAINAIEAVKALEERGFKIKASAYAKGLMSTTMSGRFEVISKKPVFVIDGAHNEPASLVFRDNVSLYFKDKKIIYIICVLKDKEYGKVINNTVSAAWQVITCTSPNRRRGLPGYELAKAVSEVNPNVTAADSIDEAVELSLMLADKDTVIISFGSLSHLSRVKEIVEHKNEIKKDRHGKDDK
ncbi:MAG: bifunctional folylpolyglutamate synthase/dihydrofolate synthase [Lachnospiraceae bacterium]|nr:bifunctional folylpolyglutamate synthase/dihydrofolate synthase [Lachnospiraceae bacterium]